MASKNTFFVQTRIAKTRLVHNVISISKTTKGQYGAESAATFFYSKKLLYLFFVTKNYEPRLITVVHRMSYSVRFLLKLETINTGRASKK